MAQPVSILVNTYGTGKLSDEEITEIVKKNFDLRPAAIIKNFDLRRPIYKQVAAYGHFGRTDLDLPWEKLDMVDVFKERNKNKKVLCTPLCRGFLYSFSLCFSVGMIYLG